MQRRGVRIGAGVARDHVQLMHRYVELAALVIVQVQELFLAVAHVDRDQALVAADTVLAVHHRVADLQFGQVAHHGIDGGGLFLLAAAAAAHGLGVQLGLGDESDALVAQDEALVQRRHPEHEAGLAAHQVGAVGHAFGVQAAGGEHLRQRLAPAGGFRADHHAAVAAHQERFEIDERVFRAAVDGHVGQRQRERGITRLGAQYEARMRFGGDEERLFVEVQRGGRQQRPVAVVAHEVVALRGVGPEAPHRGFDVADQRQVRGGRQVVEQRRRFFEEQRQVILDAGRGHAVADVLVDGRAGRIALEHFAPAAAESGARGLVHRELAAR